MDPLTQICGGSVIDTFPLGPPRNFQKPKFVFFFIMADVKFWFPSTTTLGLIKSIAQALGQFKWVAEHLDSSSELPECSGSSSSELPERSGSSSELPERLGSSSGELPERSGSSSSEFPERSGSSSSELPERSGSSSSQLPKCSGSSSSQLHERSGSSSSCPSARAVHQVSCPSARAVHLNSDMVSAGLLKPTWTLEYTGNRPIQILFDVILSSKEFYHVQMTSNRIASFRRRKLTTLLRNCSARALGLPERSGKLTALPERSGKLFLGQLFLLCPSSFFALPEWLEQPEQLPERLGSPSAWQPKQLPECLRSPSSLPERLRSPCSCLIQFHWVGPSAWAGQSAWAACLGAWAGPKHLSSLPKRLGWPELLLCPGRLGRLGHFGSSGCSGHLGHSGPSVTCDTLGGVVINFRGRVSIVEVNSNFGGQQFCLTSFAHGKSLSTAHKKGKYYYWPILGIFRIFYNFWKHKIKKFCPSARAGCLSAWACPSTRASHSARASCPSARASPSSNLLVTSLIMVRFWWTFFCSKALELPHHLQIESPPYMCLPCRSKLTKN